MRPSNSAASRVVRSTSNEVVIDKYAGAALLSSVKLLPALSSATTMSAPLLLSCADTAAHAQNSEASAPVTAAMAAPILAPSAMLVKEVRSFIIIATVAPTTAPAPTEECAAFAVLETLRPGMPDRPQTHSKPSAQSVSVAHCSPSPASPPSTVAAKDSTMASFILVWVPFISCKEKVGEFVSDVTPMRMALIVYTCRCQYATFNLLASTETSKRTKTASPRDTYIRTITISPALWLGAVEAHCKCQHLKKKCIMINKEM